MSLLVGTLRFRPQVADEWLPGRKWRDSAMHKCSLVCHVELRIERGSRWGDGGDFYRVGLRPQLIRRLNHARHLATVVRIIMARADNATAAVRIQQSSHLVSQCYFGLLGGFSLLPNHLYSPSLV